MHGRVRIRERSRVSRQTPAHGAGRNHLEQFLNSCDAEQTGLGVRDHAFQLTRLLNQANNGATAKFRDWVNQAETIAMKAVEKTANRPCS